MLENKVLRNIFGANRGEIIGESRTFYTASFVLCVLHLIELGILNRDNGDGKDM